MIALRIVRAAWRTLLALVVWEILLSLVSGVLISSQVTHSRALAMHPDAADVLLRPGGRTAIDLFRLDPGLVDRVLSPLIWVVGLYALSVPVLDLFLARSLATARSVITQTFLAPLVSRATAGRLFRRSLCFSALRLVGWLAWMWCIQRVVTHWIAHPTAWFNDLFAVVLATWVGLFVRTWLDCCTLHLCAMPLVPSFWGLWKSLTASGTLCRDKRRAISVFCWAEPLVGLATMMLEFSLPTHWLLSWSAIGAASVVRVSVRMWYLAWLLNHYENKAVEDKP